MTDKRPFSVLETSRKEGYSTVITREIVCVDTVMTLERAVERLNYYFNLVERLSQVYEDEWIRHGFHMP